MHRELSRGAKGNDVTQLQRYLQAEGYLAAGAKIDGDFGRATRNALRAWQRDHGLAKTGRVDARQLMFLPYDAVRVASAPRLGEAASGGVLEVTLPELLVTVDTSVRRKAAFEGDAVVRVRTADGTRHDAAVESITARQEQDAFGEQKFRVELRLLRAPRLEAGEVGVEALDVLAEDALTVPASALVALTEGGYGVEVMTDDGATEYRGVEIGEFADGWVEITGNVAEGDRVVVPR